MPIHTHNDTDNHSHTHTHSHNHELFSDIYSTKEFQLFDIPLEIQDTNEVAAAKKAVETNETYDNLIELGGVLCFQLRYREAANAFERAVELDGDKILAHRKLALCYLKTNRLEKSQAEFSLCDVDTPDSLDITYRLGLVAYYLGDYAKAKEEFFRSFELSKDWGEMYIAVIYWYILTTAKLNENLDYVTSLYNDEIQVGHHVGYDLTAKLFCKIDTQENLYNIAKSNDEMTFTIYL
ncbi:MAG: tetratricopeptide repeat protein, partial [Clostridia bacterium]